MFVLQCKEGHKNLHTKPLAINGMESQRIEATEPVYNGISGRIKRLSTSGKPGTGIRAYPGKACFTKPMRA
jgi:hypothetical protein